MLFCPNAVVWGDVATALGALGTLLAVLVALGVFLHDRNRRRRDDHRHQAELVTGWIRYYSQTGREVVEIGEDGVRRETGRVVQDVSVTVGLVNNSGGVVYEVLAELSDPKGEDAPIWATIGSLGPGKWQVDVRPPLVYMSMPAEAALSIYFTDSRTVSWRRNPNGVLTEAPSPSRPEHSWSVLPLPLEGP